MANGFGDNHAARAPPEIGCQDNQAGIAKILNRTLRYQDDSRRNGFYVRCMLDVEGTVSKSSRRPTALVSPRHRSRSRTRTPANARPERFDKVAQVLLFTFRIFGAPRIRIVGHRLGACLSPFAGAFGRPLRIVKLIGHAKSTDAAHGRSTLLKGEKAAIGGGETTIGGCVKHRHHQRERRHKPGHKAHFAAPDFVVAPGSKYPTSAAIFRQCSRGVRIRPIPATCQAWERQHLGDVKLEIFLHPANPRCSLTSNSGTLTVSMR